MSKGKIGNLCHARVGEVVFSDTFESGDSKYRYGQAYFDMVSHWGDVFPMTSRTQVGLSFVDFCCRNWIPLYLVRDNIGENIGTSLLDECRKRNVKSVYICPRHPQQNYAEGYLGRVTAMASFAMVYAGAPLFMWIYAILSAVFVGNISASFYSVQRVWSTPYEVTHNEPFPDASIVVPFGCAVLVLRDSNKRSKFQNRCTMMIFVHYSDDHPLFTYAVYSPRTKRVLHRQDVIFLTSVFPMRAARTASGLGPEGDSLTVSRSPPSMLGGCPDNLSFGSWSPGDELPTYDDDVTGFSLSPPPGEYMETPENLEGIPVGRPNHPAFSESSVLVPIRAVPVSEALPVHPLASLVLEKSGADIGLLDEDNLESGFEDGQQSIERLDSFEEDALGNADVVGNLNIDALFDVDANALPPLGDASSRRPVDQRWFYEPVFADPVSEPILSKRQSKRPQRLTSSRLGRVSSESEVMGLIGASSNASDSNCLLIGSDNLMANNDFTTVPSMSVISVLATAASSVPCDGDDLTSSGTEHHQSSSEDPVQTMDAPDLSTNPPGDDPLLPGSQLPLAPRRFSVGNG